MSTDDALSHCARAVRRHDYDHYLCALFAPRRPRARLIALHALELELTRVRARVSEPLLGRIRLQWWRDILLTGGDGGAHPVVVALAETGAAAALSPRRLEVWLDACERDLDQRPSITHAEATGIVLTALALDALGIDDAEARRASDHIGAAWALVVMLRDGTAPSASRDDMAGLARRRLAAARGIRVPRAALPALLPARLAELYLRRLERLGDDTDGRRMAHPPLGRLPRLLLAYARGSFLSAR